MERRRRIRGEMERRRRKRGRYGKEEEEDEGERRREMFASCCGAPSFLPTLPLSLAHKEKNSLFMDKDCRKLLPFQ